MEANTQREIEQILLNCVRNTLTRIKAQNSPKPFHEALIPRRIMLASAFERSFSTSFGQGAIEEISVLVSRNNGFTAQRQHSTQVDITKSSLDEINRIMSSLRSGTSSPQWEKEVQRVVALQKGDRVTQREITDLFLTDASGHETYISIKTAQPNLDQTLEAKRYMLVLKANNPSCSTFLAMYYNPHGSNRMEYKRTPAFKIFDMHRDPCVLIGKDYWDYLGGPRTYESLIQTFRKVGLSSAQLLQEADLL